MKFNRKTFLVLFALATCLLFYQNCSTTRGLQNLREVSLGSNVSIDMVDKQGQPFLTWEFQPYKAETLVRISPSQNQFCQRAFILEKNYESRWASFMGSLSGNRVPAGQNQGIFRMNIKDQNVSLSAKDAQNLFALMEKTKSGHKIKVSNCKNKKWAFNKITIEGLTNTENNSKYLRVVDLKVLGGNAALTKVKEEPVDVAMNSKDMFCDYTFREYKPNSALLSVMYAANELSAMNEVNGRGLASVSSGAGDSRKVAEYGSQPSYLVTVDGGEKLVTSGDSELIRRVDYLVKNIKKSPKARRSCAYTY